MQVALLASLDEPVGPDASFDEAILAFEIAQSLSQFGSDHGGMTIDLFAARGSWRGLPLVSIDLDELGGSAYGRLGRFARHEAAYVQVWLAGLLSGYDVVHCLAPVVTPLQLSARAGAGVVQTILTTAGHPATNMLPTLVPGAALRRFRIGIAADVFTEPVTMAAPVDLDRFELGPSAPRHVLLSGGGRRAIATAREIANALKVPLMRPGDDEASYLVQHALVALDLCRHADPCGSPWTLRALACGAPAAGWIGGSLDSLAGVADGLLALAPHGDEQALVRAIGALTREPATARRRRDLVLAKNGRRALAANCFGLYREVTERVRR